MDKICELSISKQLSEKLERLELSCIFTDVEFRSINNNLWTEIETKIQELSSKMEVKDISQIPAVAASRKAYKVCGKEPARYRVSAEAMLRRVLKQQAIYQVNNVVDLLNLVSISCGFSIGGYDADKIEGNIEFGIGKKDESYQGIGRGALNIEFMPVFRDDIGAFGTSTSDSVRTSVSEKTKRFLMIIVDYGGGSLPLATQMAIGLLRKYAKAKNVVIKNIK